MPARAWRMLIWDEGREMIDAVWWRGGERGLIEKGPNLFYERFPSQFILHLEMSEIAHTTRDSTPRGNNAD